MLYDGNARFVGWFTAAPIENPRLLRRDGGSMWEVFDQVGDVLLCRPFTGAAAE